MHCAAGSWDARKRGSTCIHGVRLSHSAVLQRSDSRLPRSPPIATTSQLQSNHSIRLFRGLPNEVVPIQRIQSARQAVACAGGGHEVALLSGSLGERLQAFLMRFDQSMGSHGQEAHDCVMKYVHGAGRAHWAASQTPLDKQ